MSIPNPSSTPTSVPDPSEPPRINWMIGRSCNHPELGKKLIMIAKGANAGSKVFLTKVDSDGDVEHDGTEYDVIILKTTFRPDSKQKVLKK